jgi:hypothetical protein
MPALHLNMLHPNMQPVTMHGGGSRRGGTVIRRSVSPAWPFNPYPTNHSRQERRQRQWQFLRDFLAVSGLFGTLYCWFWFGALMMG